ncbi:MAG: hypothetical protein QM426_04930 [Euryarchaeota archaeon]|nr:hypothetical protein [Euryarchaeota archaeon]
MLIIQGKIIMGRSFLIVESSEEKGAAPVIGVVIAIPLFSL